MPAMSGHGASGLARLHAMQYAIMRTSIAMGTTSPEQVLANFIDIAKGAGPVIGSLVTIMVPWAMLITAFTRYDWICARCTEAKDYAVSWLFASVSIPSSHPLHGQLQQWLVEHGLGANARSLTIKSPSVMHSGPWPWPVPTPIQHAGPDALRMLEMMRNDAVDKNGSTPRRDDLSYVPEIGQYTFTFQGRRMTYERKVVPAVVTKEELQDGSRAKRRSQEGSDTIVISCFSPIGGVQPIQTFLSYVRESALRASREAALTAIHRPKGYEWDHGITRPKRTLDGIVLDGSVKQSLVHDVDNYLRPATRSWYSQKGIPWRRGLLLYGPPGTGKTSFTTALAGHFTLNIYIISLSSSAINDRKLERLFEQLPPRCILLLEDVDSAGIRREGVTPEKKRKERKLLSRMQRHPVRYDSYGQPIADYQSDDEDEEEGITMSGLLNVLDGVHAVEGRITIMTSNHPDRLDPALVRPGRIDHKVLFGNASQEVAAKLFEHIFIKVGDEASEGEDGLDAVEIVRLSKEFASNIPAGQLTPAEVQGFLLVHRAAPLDAVKAAGQWADGLVKSKAMGSNVIALEHNSEPAPAHREDVNATILDWDFVRKQSEALSRERSALSLASSPDQEAKSEQEFGHTAEPLRKGSTGLGGRDDDGLTAG